MNNDKIKNIDRRIQIIAEELEMLRIQFSSTDLTNDLNRFICDLTMLIDSMGLIVWELKGD